MSENDLFTIFPDLPWPTPRIPRRASRVFGPGRQPPEISRRLLTAERLPRERRRLTSVHIAHDALRRIHVIALNERRRLRGKSGHSEVLDEIIARANAALRSTTRA